jgi:hypothetical protein
VSSKPSKPPFLAITLDAKRKAALVASALGLNRGDICWGLLELWEFTWREDRAVVSGMELRAFFGSNGELTAALCEFEFLEPQEGGWRVRGAEKWLKVRVAQRESGKAHAGNLKRGREPGRPGESKEAVPGCLPALPGEEPAGSAPALTPSTQHPAPSTLKEATAGAVAQQPPKETLAVVVTEPTTPPDTWSGEDFWRWFQARRQSAGFVSERPPRGGVSRWYSQAMATVGGNVETLKEAVLRFGDDRFWQAKDPPLPWQGFASQCPPKWIPRRENHAQS